MRTAGTPRLAIKTFLMSLVIEATPSCSNRKAPATPGRSRGEGVKPAPLSAGAAPGEPRSDAANAARRLTNERHWERGSAGNP
ncbi:MAG: hypothetical protein Kow0092_04250 [Deferrisomatales bacterium]